MLTSSIGKKTVMAISGAMLSLFLLAHMVGNTTAFFGREAFNDYAGHIHDLGGILKLLEAGLLFFLLVHAGVALLLYLENMRARPERYAVKKSSGSGLIAQTMPYTGLAILIFLIVHLTNFHFTDRTTPPSEMIREVLSRPEFALFYIFSVLAAALHISHGLWSLFQTLGLSHPRYNKLIMTGGIICGIAVGTVFVLIPVLAVIYSGFLL